jgi:ADP-heptose:LPS heptosyltransferase
MVGLDLNAREREYAAQWAAQVEAQYPDVVLVAVGPGSKWPSKLWPEARFEEVIRYLLSTDERIYPIIVGGKDESSIGEHLLAAWGKGINLAGVLSPRLTSAILHHCSLFLGNDTGAVHLAAAAGTPCVAVFSAQDLPGRWHPYGEQHIVFRKHPPCEGCKLFTCPHGNACLLEIQADEVAKACIDVLNRNTGRRAHKSLTRPT